MLLEKSIELPGYNQQRKCREGWMIYNKNDKYLGKSLEVYGEFSDGEVEVFRKLIPSGGFVVEVGANMGAHTVAFANLVGRNGVVIAFEPQRLMYMTLCANVAINSLAQAYCRNEAVSNAPGELRIPDLDPNAELNFGGYSIEMKNEGTPTNVITLDQLMIPQCDFVKIDVEGMEVKVLAGGEQFIKKHRPILYVENDRRDQRDQIIQMIDALDYVMYWHLPPLFNPDNYNGVSENIFGDLRSTNMLCMPREKGPTIHGLELIDPSKKYEIGLQE